MTHDINKPGNLVWKILLTAALISGIATVGFMLPRVRLAINASQYRNHGAQAPFLYVYQSLRNGDRIEEVQALLGPGIPNHDPKYRKACEKVFAAHPDEAPSGILESDLILGYSAATSGIYLQFRDGVLVNHDPKLSPFLDGAIAR